MKIVYTKTLSKNARGTFTIKMKTSDDWTAATARMIAKLAHGLRFGRNGTRLKELDDLLAKWDGEDVADDISDAFDG